MDGKELLDINGNIRKWNSIKTIEFKEGLVEGLTKHNSKLAIDMFKDFENGINCTTKGIRTPASLLRIRRTWRILSKRIGKKENDIEKVTREKLSQIIVKENSEHFARNIKVIFNWLERTKRIKDNPTKHITPSMFSKGKPPWVYLGEENMKLLLNSLGFNHRALYQLLIDSGMRPEEAWRIIVSDFQEDFKVLDIPEKRSNGQRVAKKNSFGRKIKLKLCSELIKEYIQINHLQPNDLLFNMTQAGFNKALRVQAVKLFGKEPTKARESPDKITAYDIRHNSACYWLKRYKTHRDLMYRFGWKNEDKIFYYTEFLDMRDTIDDEDMLTKEDKTLMEKEIDNLKKDLERQMQINKEELKEIKNAIDKLSEMKTGDNFNLEGKKYFVLDKKYLLATIKNN